MFDGALEVDFDSLDLGCKRREPVEWVAIAPETSGRVKHQHQRRSNGRRRGTSRRARRGLLASTPLETELSATRLPHEVGLSSNERALTDSLVASSAFDVQQLPPESDDGNVEYKLRIRDPNPLRFQQLVTQLKFRLSEGNGAAFYYIGVEDSGVPKGLVLAELQASLATLRAMAGEVAASAQLLQQFPGSTTERSCFCARIANLCSEHVHYTDLRIAVAGGLDSGKSTLVAVLTQGSNGRPLLDNSRGSARMAVFRHKHEIETGRTSSISQHILGYDGQGRVINYGGVAAPAMADIAADACKVLGFVDLGGHERYLKTALYGMTCMLPDYVLLCHNAAAPTLSKVFREHLAAALALRIPVAMVLTKVDLAPQGNVDELVAAIQQLLGSVASAGSAFLTSPLLKPCAPLVSSEAQAAELAAAIAQPARGETDARSLNLVVPIFAVSSVSGAQLPALHAFLSRLGPTVADGQLGRGSSHEPRSGSDSDTDAEACTPTRHSSTHFLVDQTFNVAGVGTVLAGTVVAGHIDTGQQLVLGPTPSGGFADVTVTGIQRAQVPVQNVGPGQHATLAISHVPQELLSSYPASLGALPGPDMAPAGAAAVHHRPTASDLSGLSCSATAASEAAPLQHGQRAASSLHESLQQHTLQQTGSRLQHTSVPGDDFRLQGHATHGSQNTAQQRSDTADGQTHDPRSSVDVSNLTRQLQASSARQASEAGQAGGAARLGSPLHESALSHDAMASRSQSSPALMGASPPNSRKGMVLLDSLMNPQTTWEFTAILVLLSGHWPPRGLLSGCWPPGLHPAEAADEAAAEAAHAAPGSSSSESGTRGSARERVSMPTRKTRSGYAPVVHCGSVRQAAKVLTMRELRLSELSSPAQTEAILPAIAAAAAILGHPGDVGMRGPGPGCIALVKFCFVHRPEWLCSGACLLVRDRGDGCIAGAGFISGIGSS